MAINKNHEFEELNGIKCAIVERNASQERVDFLKELLEFNKYTVVVAPTVVKAAAVPASAPAATASTEPALQPAPDPAPPPPPPPASFTIGVTDVAFNSTNAIFGRLLKTKDGRIVTLGYWQQKETVSQDEVPYFGDVINKGSTRT